MTLPAYVSHVVQRLYDGGPRPAGSESHHAAAAFLEGELARIGYKVGRQEYDCPDWTDHGAAIWIGQEQIPCIANTHTPPCDIAGPVIAACSAEDLASATATGAVLVLHGPLMSDAFLPENFDFYRNEKQDALIARVEENRPAAVVFISSREEPLLPLIEDDQFGIPSVTISASAGSKVLGACKIRLRIKAENRPSTGCNIVARRHNPSENRIIISAHYDTKPTTAGAVDNASGVAALLAIAEITRGRPCADNLEFVVFGGEDTWYPGDLLYTQQPEFRQHAVAAAINIDGVGVAGSPVTFAFFHFAQEEAAKIVAGAHEHLAAELVAPWYAGDHSLFWPRNIPTIAVCSRAAFDLTNTILHTKADTPDLLDYGVIARTAEAIAGLLKRL